MINVSVKKMFFLGFRKAAFQRYHVYRIPLDARPDAGVPTGPALVETPKLYPVFRIFFKILLMDLFHKISNLFSLFLLTTFITCVIKTVRIVNIKLIFFRQKLSQ